MWLCFHIMTQHNLCSWYIFPVTLSCIFWVTKFTLSLKKKKKLPASSLTFITWHYSTWTCFGCNINLVLLKQNLFFSLSLWIHPHNTRRNWIMCTIALYVLFMFVEFVFTFAHLMLLLSVHLCASILTPVYFLFTNLLLGSSRLSYVHTYIKINSCWLLCSPKMLQLTVPGVKDRAVFKYAAAHCHTLTYKRIRPRQNFESIVKECDKNTIGQCDCL